MDLYRDRHLDTAPLPVVLAEDQAWDGVALPEPPRVGEAREPDPGQNRIVDEIVPVIVGIEPFDNPIILGVEPFDNPIGRFGVPATSQVSG